MALQGWTQRNIQEMTSGELRAWIRRGLRAVENAAGVTPCFFRPPYGSTAPGLKSICDEFELRIVGWDVSLQDWEGLSEREMIKELAVQGVMGKILLFHDALPNVTGLIAALKWLVHAGRGAGVEPISLSAYSTYREVPSC